MAIDMDQAQIQALVDEYFEIEVTMNINPNGVVDVTGDVENINLFIDGRIPVKFGNVTGSFVVSSGNIKTLENCPHAVGGDFSCSLNFIESLEHAPRTVGGSLDASLNDSTFKSLKGLPDSICHSKKVSGPAVVISWKADMGLLSLITKDIAYGNSGKGLKMIGAPPDLVTIMNKYITKSTTPGGRRAAAVACSIEMIRAGFKGNARV